MVLNTKLYLQSKEYEVEELAQLCKHTAKFAEDGKPKFWFLLIGEKLKACDVLSFVRNVTFVYILCVVQFWIHCTVIALL